MNKSPQEKAKERYEKKRSKLTVSFNLEDESDLKLLEHARSINFSLWAKEMLLKDMLKHTG